MPLGYEHFAGDKQFATTLARGIELLRGIAAGDAMLSNADLAERRAEPTAGRSLDIYREMNKLSN